MTSITCHNLPARFSPLGSKVLRDYCAEERAPGNEASCFGEFADKAAIVWYVKLIPQPHTIMHNRQTPEVAMVVAYLCVYTVCVTTIDMFRVLAILLWEKVPLGGKYIIEIWAEIAKNTMVLPT